MNIFIIIKQGKSHLLSILLSQYNYPWLMLILNAYQNALHVWQINRFIACVMSILFLLMSSSCQKSIRNILHLVYL